MQFLLELLKIDLYLTVVLASKYMFWDVSLYISSTKIKTGHSTFGAAV